MPAVSQKQQQFFGLIHAVQTGKVSPSKVSGSAKKVAKEMSPGEVEKFASTKRKGLPKKKVTESIGTFIEFLTNNNVT